MTRLRWLGTFLLGRRRHVLAGLLMGGSVVLGATKAAAHSESIHRNESAQQQKLALLALIDRAMGLSDAEKLDVVNRFFNHRIRYGEDKDVWGQFDYWASPLETLERSAGDCEDFALAKYFTLRLLGIPERNLHLVYTTVSSTRQAHMVLGYWNDGGEMPVLLDNLRPDILPMTQRQDLQIVFAFDTRHLYRFDRNRLVSVGDAKLLPGWQVLMAKARQELSPSSSVIQLAMAE